MNRSQRHVANILFETLKPYISLMSEGYNVQRTRTMEKQGVISAAYIPIIISRKKKTVLGTLAVGSQQALKFSTEKISLLQTLGLSLAWRWKMLSYITRSIVARPYIENLVENAADIILSTVLEDQILTPEPRGRTHIRLQQKKK